MLALRKPAALRITGTRGQAGADGAVPPLGLDISGTIADLTLSTVKPVVPGPGQAPPEAGEIQVKTPDIAPFLLLAGSTSALPSPLPADLLVGLSRAGRDAHADVAGRIAGAGLDVYEGEPQMAPGLADCSNALLLPHLGSATHETRASMSRIAAENLVAALSGQAPPNPVNPEALTARGTS